LIVYAARLLLLYAVLRAVYELGQDDAHRDLKLRMNYLYGRTYMAGYLDGWRACAKTESHDG
jgi:hypothetical protein